MATKTISELQLRSSVTSGVNFPTDDGIQTYRVTAEQLKNFILSNQSVLRSMIKIEERIPIGSLYQFAGSTAPDGFMLCYGQAVSRSTYADLFNVIGTTYGVGDGSTTFNLPDLRGRVIAGRDDMGGSAANRLTTQVSPNGNTLGAAGGAQTDTLTVDSMPSHTHTQNAHNHGITDTGHIHGGNYSTTKDNGSSQTPSASTDGNTRAQQSSVTSSITGITINNATATNQNTGGGAAHNNTQPTIIMNYIIKH